MWPSPSLPWCRKPRAALASPQDKISKHRVSLLSPTTSPTFTSTSPPSTGPHLPQVLLVEPLHPDLHTNTVLTIPGCSPSPCPCFCQAAPRTLRTAAASTCRTSRLPPGWQSYCFSYSYSCFYSCSYSCSYGSSYSLCEPTMAISLVLALPSPTGPWLSLRSLPATISCCRAVSTLAESPPSVLVLSDISWRWTSHWGVDLRCDLVCVVVAWPTVTGDWVRLLLQRSQSYHTFTTLQLILTFRLEKVRKLKTD